MTSTFPLQKLRRIRLYLLNLVLVKNLIFVSQKNCFLGKAAFTLIYVLMVYKLIYILIYTCNI